MPASAVLGVSLFALALAAPTSALSDELLVTASSALEIDAAPMSAAELSQARGGFDVGNVVVNFGVSLPQPPAITAPVAPIVTPPTAPVITALAAPAVVAPAAPAVTPPTAPVVAPPAAPSAPLITAPAIPVVTAPVAPAVTSPTTPVIATPTAPAVVTTIPAPTFQAVVTQQVVSPPSATAPDSQQAFTPVTTLTIAGRSMTLPAQSGARTPSLDSALSVINNTIDNVRIVRSLNIDIYVDRSVIASSVSAATIRAANEALVIANLLRP